MSNDPVDGFRDDINKALADQSHPARTPPEARELRIALETVMAYPDIRAYLGKQVSDIASAALAAKGKYDVTDDNLIADSVQRLLTIHPHVEFFGEPLHEQLSVLIDLVETNYAKLPKPEAPLTDEEIKTIWWHAESQLRNDSPDEWWLKFARAVLAAQARGTK